MPRITPKDLHGQDWHREVHQLIQPPEAPVHEYADAIADEVSGRYRDTGPVEALDKKEVAEVINTLNDRDLSPTERWLLTRPFVLARALHEGAKAQSADARAGEVREFLRADVEPATQEMLLDHHLGVNPPQAPPEGTVLDRQEIVNRWGERRLDVTAPIDKVIGDVLAAGATPRGEQADAAQRAAGATRPQPPLRPSSQQQATGQRAGEQRLDVAAGRPAREFRSWQFRDEECAFTPPGAGAVLVVRPRQEVLQAAQQAVFSYMFLERQPTRAAMDALQNKVNSGEVMLWGESAGVAAAGEIDDGCDVRMLVYGWGKDGVPLTTRQRAAVAEFVGIPDPAGQGPVNQPFSAAMETFVGLLVRWATDCCDEPLRWIRPALDVAALRVAATLEEAITGAHLWALMVQRREYESANLVLRSRHVRDTLGVGADPDPGAAPAVRRLLPGVRFDLNALTLEYDALATIFEVVSALAGPDPVAEDVLQRAADAAVTLFVLRGRLDPGGVIGSRPPLQGA